MLKWFSNKSYDSKYRIDVLKYYHTHTHTISSDMLVETTILMYIMFIVIIFMKRISHMSTLQEHTLL